ncbi:MAG TPA: type II toxin-antitoxin system VapC family toxin [Pyrinomonadaceae bacterium]|nr:type II toxin-antitoxin system VapC family toxin [Pyrinomonadaceae bacterium]
MFVTDTHALIWYLTGKHSQLSSKVLQAFQKAENGEIIIYIPSVVFWEIALLEKRGRIALKDGFEKWSRKVLSKSGFAIAHLETEIIAKAVGYNFNEDPFDAAIVATAIEFEVPLITKDVAITESNLVEIYW